MLQRNDEQYEITATFDVRADPARDDPHDVVGFILDTYNEWARVNGHAEVGEASLQAEW